MVEHNHDEERLARIEHIVERLQREQTTLTLLTENLSRTVAKRSVVVTFDRRRRSDSGPTPSSRRLRRSA